MNNPKTEPIEAPEPSLQRITDADLPRLFQLADRYAISSQQRARHSQQIHLACLIGASVSQMCTSLGEEINSLWTQHLSFPPFPEHWSRNWQILLAGFVLLSLMTRFLLKQRQPDQPWVKSRGLAEQVKRLAWYYMAGFGRESAPLPGDGEALRQFLNSLEPIRDDWKKLAPPDTDPLIQTPEISPAMRALRAAPLTVRKRRYVEDRLLNQIDWLERKAALHVRRAKRFSALQIATEIAALLTAFFYVAAFKDFLKWNSLMWPLLTSAASLLAWNNYRRYRETAAQYARTAETLIPLRQELEDLGDATDAETRFAEYVRRCEEILGRENELWFTRRGG